MEDINVIDLEFTKMNIKWQKTLNGGAQNGNSTIYIRGLW